MTTPKTINESWIAACWRYGFDPVELDEHAKKILYNQPSDLIGIRASIDGMNTVKDKVPEFFKAHDYVWAFDTIAWRKSLEAKYQVRVFQLLSSLWVSPNKPKHLDFSDVVVRFAFASNVDPCTPSYIAYNHIHFIRMPFSFNEMVLLFTRAFCDVVRWDVGGWTFKLPQNDFVSPYIKQILLRHLTDEKFHSSEPGENPTDSVKRESDWFIEATEGNEEQNALEIFLTYSLIDFAIAHELGHRLLGHKNRKNQSTIRDIRKEFNADKIGFGLFVTSWGWRDEIIDSTPLSEGSRILVGPLFFHMFNEWYLTLKTGILLLKQKQGLKVKTSYKAQLELDVKESQQRTIQTMNYINEYLQRMVANGYQLSQTDKTGFTSLANAMNKFNDYLLTSLQSIPDNDFNIAYEAGRSSLFS